jgi:hypothetical protein
VGDSQSAHKGNRFVRTLLISTDAFKCWEASLYLERQPNMLDTLKVPNGSTAIQPLVFTPKQAAQIIGYSTSWLAKRRLDGTGPRFIKGPKNVSYQRAALEDWLATQRCFTSTSEYSRG